MQAKTAQRKPFSKDALLKALGEFPSAWGLTPVNGNKIPYRASWQSEKLDRSVIAKDIQSGRAKAVGLLTGSVSGGIVAVDADGHAPHEKILELSGGVLLPETVAFASGKPGRCQYLFYVPQEFWGAIATKKIGTGVYDEGKHQQLELRWDGQQSVLPPSAHPDTGCYEWRKSYKEIAIASCPLWIIEQMLQEPSPQPSYGQIQLPVAESVPLELCLTKRSREMLESGAAAPNKGRNDSGAELARDLIGTAAYLEKIGQTYNGNPEVLFFDWSSACGLDSDKPKGQPQAIWKSANKDNPTPGSGEDGVDSCVKGWHWRENIKPTGRNFSTNRRSFGGGSGGGGGDDGDGGDRNKSKIVRFPGTEPASLEQLTEAIDELISQGVAGSKLTAEQNRLAAASQWNVLELRKLYYERRDESEIECDRTDNHSEIESLLKFTEQTLALEEFLPEGLAHPINQWCAWLNVRPAVALTALLAGISSCHATGTELVLQWNQNFRVPSTILAALVSFSGQKKSPIFHNIIRLPLIKLREEKVAAYEMAIADYEAELQEWEQAEDKGRRPEKPKDPTLYYFTNATGEAIPIQASKAPEKALLALIDELSGYFNSSNAYRSGRGSDKQDLLSYFDGTGQTVLRAGGVRVDLPKIYLSIFGTIQPEILKKHMEDCSDPDGNWARFLFVNQPLVASILHDDDGLAYQISDLLLHYYRQVDRLPEMEYRLSRKAFKAYQAVYNQLERLRVTHPKSGMAAVYSKMEGYIGRLALNLHVLWELEAGKEIPAEEIPLHIMEKAIALAKFYMGQVKLIHAHSDEESLPSHITKLIELSKRLEANGGDGWVRAKIFCEQFRAKKRITAQQARQWMQEAVSLGYGCTKGDANRLEYHWKRDNNTPSGGSPSPNKLGELGETRGRVGEDVPLVETIENTGFEPTGGTRGSQPPSFFRETPKGFVKECEQEQEQEQACLEAPLVKEEESSLEGGILPLPSPSVSQEAQSQGLVSDSALEETGGTASPTLPLPSPSGVVEEAIAQKERETLQLIVTGVPSANADTSTNSLINIDKDQLAGVISRMGAGILWHAAELSDRQLVSKLASLKKEVGEALFEAAAKKQDQEGQVILQRLKVAINRAVPTALTRQEILAKPKAVAELPQSSIKRIERKIEPKAIATSSAPIASVPAPKAEPQAERFDKESQPETAYDF